MLNKYSLVLFTGLLIPSSDQPKAETVTVNLAKRISPLSVMGAISSIRIPAGCLTVSRLFSDGWWRK